MSTSQVSVETAAAKAASNIWRKTATTIAPVSTNTITCRQDSNKVTSNYEHLSKKSRIELVGAANDHNYILRRGEPAEESAELTFAPSESNKAAGGHMDDCMAAMVLMFLSCRPGGQLSEETLRELQQGGAKSAAAVELQKLQTAAGKVGGAKRNSEPIEMDTSSQQKLYQRHFKRRLFSTTSTPTTTTATFTSVATAAGILGQEIDIDVELESTNHRKPGGRRRRLNGATTDDDDDDDEDDEVDEIELRASLAFVESAPPKVEDEMIFELQQVDQIEEAAAAAAASASVSFDSQSDKNCNNPISEFTEGKKAAGGGVEAKMSPSVGELKAPAPARQPQQIAPVNLCSSNINEKQQQVAQLKQQQQQPLRYRMNNPVKTRTIFSCMWPGCTKNYDALEDIERHVRSHLGPKQCESIGEEDFYYEETEVDEATYLAIFSRNNSVLPLSPSHNSDGLSSGQSFASSSPATSPVCSTDSSSSSSSSSSSASSSASNSSYPASQLYANSIDWNHFLADHNQLLRASPAAGKWLPSGVFLGPSPDNSIKQNQTKRAARQTQQVYQHAARFGRCHAPVALGFEPVCKSNRVSLQSKHSAESNHHRQCSSPPRLLMGAAALATPPTRVAPAAAAPTAAAHRSRTHLSSSLASGQQADGPLQFSMQLTGGSPLPHSSALYRRGSPKSHNNSNNHLINQNQSATTANENQQKHYLAKQTHDHTYNTPPTSSKSSAPGIAPKRAGRKPKPEGYHLGLIVNGTQIRHSKSESSSSSSSVSPPKLSGQTNHPKQQNPNQQFFHNQSTSPHHNNKFSSNRNNNCNSFSARQGKLSASAAPNNNGAAGGGGRKSGGRGENNKCRKVHGMERKHEWCLQCRWKKACSRYNELNKQ